MNESSYGRARKRGNENEGERKGIPRRTGRVGEIRSKYRMGVLWSRESVVVSKRGKWEVGEEKEK